MSSEKEERDPEPGDRVLEKRDEHRRNSAKHRAEVGHEFNRLIANSELHFIDKCCHAPMMECPDRFNTLLNTWLAQQVVGELVA